MATLKTTCPRCMKSFQIADARLGRGVRCPWCEQRFQLTVERIRHGLQPEELGNWYCFDSEGARVGPLALVELIRRRKNGMLIQSTQIWREGWPHWKFADQLFSSLPSIKGDSQEHETEVGMPPPTTAVVESPSVVAPEQSQRLAEELTSLGRVLSQLRTALGLLIGLLVPSIIVILVWSLRADRVWGLVGMVGLMGILFSMLWLRGHLGPAKRAIRTFAESGERAAGIEGLARGREVLRIWTWSMIVLAIAALSCVVAAIAT